VFDELAAQNVFPSGNLEILVGRYSHTGSNIMVSKIV